MAPAIACKTCKKNKHGETRDKTNDSDQKMCVSWKPVNTQECVWKKFYRNIMRTTSQEKGAIHYNIRIWYTHLFLCLRQWRYPQQKQQWIKNGKKLEKIPVRDKTKVRNKSDVIDGARKEGRKVHFASLMDLCQLKNAELETKHQKYKGRVVLRGDIVKDDSGSRAVFTERGSSASQMTAAKVMDITSRLPGCSGQAADAVSAYNQVKMEDAPTLLKKKKTKVRMSRYLDTSTEAQMAQIMVQYGRSSCSSWTKSVRSPFGREYYGNGNSRKFNWNTVVNFF